MRKMAHELNQRKLPYRMPNNTNADEWLKQRELQRTNFEPAPWWNYFSAKDEISIRNGDSLILWKSCSATDPATTDEGLNDKDLPYILMLHGGGYSGLTWGPMIDELSHIIVAEFGALDLRGHGESHCKDESDLSLSTLTEDVLEAINFLQEKQKSRKLDKRPLILVGHSMGGALGVNVATILQEKADVNLAGLVVLDVVEGSAMQALTSMQFFLRSRPQEFKSLSEAIQWCVRSGQTKNLDSARISIPGQLKVRKTAKSAGLLCQPSQLSQISEDSADSVPTSNVCAPPPSSPSDSFLWRIDLSKTEPYWRGWFEGLSKKFLAVRCPKLLMLAGVDRLDKELTVGQMQGKFQMQVFHQVGHSVHEDAPEKAAECIASFLNRQKLVKTKAQLTPCLPGC